MWGLYAMTDLLPFIITGLVTGSLYGLAGLGLVLTYRTSGILNFAHGTVGAAAAYAFYTLHVHRSLPWPIAGVIVLAIFGVAGGAILERLTRRLANASEAIVVVATIALLLGVQGLLYMLYGSTVRNFPDFLPTSGFTVRGVNVTWSQVISFSLASAFAVALYIFLRTSRLGVSMRAVVDNPTLTSLAGERPARIRASAWIVGSGFAAMSGILLAPTLGLDAYLLSILVVQAFGACAIGAFKSLPLTFIGGLVVGVAASLATRYFTTPPWTGLPTAVPFLVLIAVLLIVPTRRFPQRSIRAHSLLTLPTSGSRTSRIIVVAVAAVVLVALPHVVGVKLPVWTSAVSHAILFASLGLLVWTSGQISLCHAAFFALGATSMAHLSEWGVPWLIAVVVAGLFTVPVGALVAVPAIRLSGIYLALATLGFGILMQNVVYPSKLMFGPALIVSAPRPTYGPFDGTSDIGLYYLLVTAAVICLVAMAALGRSRLGDVLRAMSESPTLLATHGLDVNVAKVLVFAISSFFAGVAGALAITQTGGASGVSFAPLFSLVFLAVLAISGTRLIRSAVIASLLFAVAPGYLTSFDADRQSLAFGLAALCAALVLGSRGQMRAWVTRSVAAGETRLTRSPVRSRLEGSSAPLAPEVLT